MVYDTGVLAPSVSVSVIDLEVTLSAEVGQEAPRWLFDLDHLAVLLDDFTDLGVERVRGKTPHAD